MNEEVKEVTQGEVASTEPTVDVAAPIEPTVAETTTIETGSFLDGISDDVRGEACLKDFKDLDGLAKSYVSAQRMLGKSIRIPGPDAGDEQRAEFLERLSSVEGVVKLPSTEEEKAAFFNRLGRPETPGEYKLEVPEGVTVDKDTVEEFTKLAHDIGLTNAQASKLAEFELAKEMSTNEFIKESLSKGETTLKEHWGSDFNNRLNGAKMAGEILSEKFPEETRELLEGPYGNNPALLTALSELGKLMKEAGHEGAVKSVDYGMSIDEAKEQIREIFDNRNHPYHVNGDPGHREAVSKVAKLHQIAFPK